MAAAAMKRCSKCCHCGVTPERTLGHAFSPARGSMFPTKTSCAVPDGLASELKVKVLNLSQYLQKGGIKK
jgi:hypothetical protein